MKISNNKEYQEAVHMIYNIMNKGENNISDGDARKIKTLAKAIEDYEDNLLKTMPLSVTTDRDLLA